MARSPSSSRRRISKSPRRKRSRSPSRKQKDAFLGDLTPKDRQQRLKEKDKKKRKFSRSPSPRRIKFASGLSPGNPEILATPEKLLEFRASQTTPIRDIQAHFETWLSQAHLPVATSLVETVMERLISLGIASISQLSAVDPAELEKEFIAPDKGTNRSLATQMEAISVARRLRELAVRTADKAWNSVPISGPGSSATGWEVVANSLSKILESRKKAKSPIMDADHSDDEAPKFDLGRYLWDWRSSLGDGSLLCADNFPDLSRIARLALVSTKCQGVPIVASAAPDNWLPAWIGDSLSPLGRRDLQKEWAQGYEKISFPRAISSINAFWLAHAAAHHCTVISVYSHIMLLMRLAAERSQHFAIRYERLLHTKFLSRIRASQAFSLSNDLALIDEGLIRALELETRNPRQPLTDSNMHHAPAAKAAVSHGTVSPPGSAKQQAAKPQLADRLKSQICFLHDPSQGLTCPKINQGCLREHVDTNQQDLLARFLSAKSASKGPKPKKP